MRRIERVYRIDIEHRPRCGGRVRDIACIEHPEVIGLILSHLAAREADQAGCVDLPAHFRRARAGSNPTTTNDTTTASSATQTGGLFLLSPSDLHAFVRLDHRTLPGTILLVAAVTDCTGRESDPPPSLRSSSKGR